MNITLAVGENEDKAIDAAPASEPNGVHGTRSEFIQNISEKLITRVNAEATDIEQAKALMH